jgi:hypothetical protein
MTLESPDALFVSGFQPLAPELRKITPEKSQAARLRVAEFDRNELIRKFQEAFHNGKRLVAFVLADELTRRGVPPCFRHSHLSSRTYSANQTFDLFLYDLRWLRERYPDHRRLIQYRRSRVLFDYGENSFHEEAGFAFYCGKRPAWQIVKSLRLSERQQLDCQWLQSAPIAKRCAATIEMRNHVFQTLAQSIDAVRRTASFTNEDANATLFRRLHLWVCSRYSETRKPTDIAFRYWQLTGESIGRQVVARQLQIMDEIIRKCEVQKEGEKPDENTMN